MSVAKKFKSDVAESTVGTIPEQFLRIEQHLCARLTTLTFPPPVDYIYSPVEYAYLTHSQFVHKYCGGAKKILFLGMNPGPWGMSQTGVPFGEVSIVRDWLEICGEVQKPTKELDVRPVTGFDCKRSEISGKRFWSLFQTLCGTPDKFFESSYVHNYCPIALMRKTGKNITPKELKRSESKKLLLEYCDESLGDVVRLLGIEIIVGIGGFAQERARLVTANDLSTTVINLIHPSPIIPHNENWHEKAMKVFDEHNLNKYFQ